MSDLYSDLLEAIKAHSGMDDAQILEAGAYGADAGWPGFTYTADGADFYREHSGLIDELLQEGADDFGYDDVLAFVASFNRSDMGHSDMGRHCLFAWYALEEVGQWLEREGVAS